MLAPPFYVISDTHWMHENIVRYCNRHPQIAALIGPAKPIKEVDHNQYMVERWNKVIGPDDTVLHLGDLVFAGNPEINPFFREIAPKLKGHKFLILGNHDKKRWIPFYEDAGFKVIRPFTLRYQGYDVSFDHYPTEGGVIGRGDQTIRVHGHIHNNGYQHIHAKHKEKKRYGNINVSVEMIDYTPQPIERLLNKAIEEMKPRQHYTNINGKRNGRKQSYVHENP